MSYDSINEQMKLCTKFSGYELWDDINYSIALGYSILDDECSACDDIPALADAPPSYYLENGCVVEELPLDANQCFGFKLFVFHIPSSQIVQTICAYAIND